MQSLRWYGRRLGSMSPREMAWRVQGKLRDPLDRLVRPRRARVRSVHHVFKVEAGEPIIARKVLGPHLRQGDFSFTPAEAERWNPQLIAQADRIAQHRLDFLGLDDHHLGDQINWNYEYQAKKQAPLTASGGIDYRDFGQIGDCKLVWELNRHHQFVVLARAYRITQDGRYADAISEQLDSWLRQCPYGLGMNWLSPLELAIRMINWVWTYELLDGGRCLPESLRDRVLLAVHQHLSQITRQYSRFSSANNHLVGEAGGVFICSSYFAGLKCSAKWRAGSRKLLEREIIRQTYLDGGTREQATGYHVFVLWFFLLAGLCARRGGEDFPPEYWKRMERMFDYLAALTDGADTLPQIGDCDDGYVVDLGGRAEAVSSLFSIGAVLFDRPDLKSRAKRFAEPAFWLLGPEGRKSFERLEVVKKACPIRSQALPASGYYLLQRGHRGAEDRISAVFDCGELGYLSIAAHGHADALSLLLRVGGLEVMIDPGTYDYFTHARWRGYFRSTRAHNTVVIDEADQSESLGLFLWGRRAQSRLLRWEPTARGGVVVGEHDGYTSLADPVVHRRTVILPDDQPVLTVHDEICAKGPHRIATYWHFSDRCRIEQSGDNRFEVSFGVGSITVKADPRLSIELVRGSEDSMLGWVSRRYHRKRPSPTLIGRCSCQGDLTLTTRFEIVTSENRVPESPARVEIDQRP